MIKSLQRYLRHLATKERMAQCVPVRKNVILSWLRLRLRLFAGKAYNLAGVPGIVRDCDYAATAQDVRIQVKAGDLCAHSGRADAQML